MDIQAPYEAGSPQPVVTGADADAGGRDPVAGTVDGAVAAAHARLAELESDTHGQGSVIGDAAAAGPGTGATLPGEAAVYDFDGDNG